MNAPVSALVHDDLPPATREGLRVLQQELQGEVRCDRVSRMLYATDASLYQILPAAVALPATQDDLNTIVRVCRRFHIPITPRAAGTSLAGQTVGPGLIVDTGRHLTRIVALDAPARQVTVEPGVIRDDLNRWLAPHGLLFGPDTSTSNRAMVGGMVGNNSCGSWSIRYGTTRDNLAWVDVVLADGTTHRLGRMSREAWADARGQGGMLADILARLEALVGTHARAIRDAWPRPDVIRRNTGYPLDDLADSWLGDNPDRDPDLARFLCGTEGTLALIRQACLTLWPVSPCKAVVASHFETLEQALEATVAIVPHRPAAVELMDRRVLQLASLNREQARNLEVVVGDPGGLLITEFLEDTPEALEARVTACLADLNDRALGYAHPRLAPAQEHAVWELRKAGLGVLMGAPGDVKPVTLVEDTAVPVDQLPAFIRDFQRVMADHATECVYYAHASVGELHMRPELNLKTWEDVERARSIATQVADLVRRYRGALSGEHGDGRLRSPFLARVLGEEAMAWHREVKQAFDPDALFNPGIIVDALPFDQDWRVHPAQPAAEVPRTEFRWADAGGFQQAIERCNGAGVCRRTSGGTMCPSYMVTLEEQESTRGRANLFRHLLQQGPDALFRSEELHDALQLCISCKGCKRDCPASVDMASLKAEFEQGWMDRRGVPMQARLFAEVTELSRLPQGIPGAAVVTNALQRTGLFKRVAQALLGVDRRRSLPAIAPRSLHRELARRTLAVPDALGTVCLFVDEFTDRYEPGLGVAALEVLQAGGWSLLAPRLHPSGRTHLSKGFVRRARAHILHNVRTLHALLPGVEAIVGIEPSALLTLVDEALELLHDEADLAMARAVADRVRLVETFVGEQVAASRWRAELQAPAGSGTWWVHGHCHQKALVGTEGMMRGLGAVQGASVRLMNTGCCGMAGSFGYRADAFEVSQRMGELALFPQVRKAGEGDWVVAPGTSCRHQIADGTGRVALHPIEVLHRCLPAGR
jgi:FAD/FMN-containing dehydrogenase/Fe-S oxidoreductase